MEKEGGGLCQRQSGASTLKKLTSDNLPPALKGVIPEAILIGNPDSNLLESWIPDKGIRG
jgi:hypothetical protein